MSRSTRFLYILLAVTVVDALVVHLAVNVIEPVVGLRDDAWWRMPFTVFATALVLDWAVSRPPE